MELQRRAPPCGARRARSTDAFLVNRRPGHEFEEVLRRFADLYEDKLRFRLAYTRQRPWEVAGVRRRRPSSTRRRIRRSSILFAAKQVTMITCFGTLALWEERVLF